MPVPDYMAPTAWPVILCWKPWYLAIALSWMQQKKFNQLHWSILIPDWNTDGTTRPKEMILITQSLKELQLLMSDYVGIVRTNTRLQRAMKRLDLVVGGNRTVVRSHTVSPQLCELRNMITVAYVVVKCAQFRQESRGLHFNTDYPGKSEMVQNIVL